MLPRFKVPIIVIQFSFFLTILSGCAAKIEDPKHLKKDIVYEVNSSPNVKHEGSLWQENGPLSELFLNLKARRVGDIVSVNIVESSSATNRATTSTSRESSLLGKLEGFFNLEKRYPSSHPFFNPFSKVQGDLTSSFDGKGTTMRSGDLNAFITARVMSVLPNGNLMIEGSREVMVNNEKQMITLSGIIRPRDISPDNVILSTEISDARIGYSGSGVINDRQRPGWMANILNKVWPF
jgi:flagellar L-ring protein precursor FlgH